MLYHCLILTYRNMMRSKGQFIINMTGLSIGLTCSLLIYLWITDELHVDRFHEKDLQLYQVMKTNVEPHGLDTGEDTPAALAGTLKAEMPEVESAVSVFPPEDYTLKGILSFEKEHIRAASKFAQRDFFNIFSFPLLYGNNDKVLNDPYAVVISRDVAMKLFQTTENVVGRSVEWKGDWHQANFIVSGVFENLPSNTTLQFDIIFSYDFLQIKFPDMFSWQNNNSNTYVVLKNGADVNQFNNKIAGLIRSKNKESTLTLFIRRFSDKYLYGRYVNGIQAGGRIDYVKTFSIVSVIILLVACINFINLSTAKASARIKEVGVKKTFGAERSMLILQYLGESMMITFCASLLAILLVDLTLPYFNEVTGKKIQFILDLKITLSLLSLILITGIMAGCYPALYLSGFSPAAILKGRALLNQNQNASEAIWARNGLVFFQFAISVILMVCVIVVNRQIDFMQARNLGFQRDNIITFTSEGKLADSTETFLAEIKKIPGIVNASYMDGDLVKLHNGTTAVDWEGKRPDQVVDFEFLRVGYDLIETLGIEVKEGRSFSRDFNTETDAVIFNEIAMESMGLSDPIGKTVKIWGQEKVIVGVIKNFHFESLYEDLKPFFFLLAQKGDNNMLVKIGAGTEHETLAKLQEYYQDYNLGLPFEYKFLDQEYQILYASERRVSILSKYFAGVTIFLSSLGLFGLAAFIAERRYKEIGIRKVLGSSEFNIVYLLSKDFTKLVVLAIAVALPVSYMVSRSWLNTFAYRIDLQWWYFFAAGLVTLLISWATIGTQAIKASRTNTAKCMREE